MEEIEVKILEIRKQKVEEELLKMGARKTFDGEMETFFYDFRDGAIIKAKNVLRLRREDDKVVLTYKNVAGTKKAKIAQEYSVDVSNLAIMQKILESLGLVLIESMQKHRTSYELEGTNFDIDRYHGRYSYIPEFMEVEAGSITLIHKFAKALGFKPEDCLPWSTVQVIEYYSKNKKERA
jgi:adenylate cyclase class 2